MNNQASAHLSGDDLPSELLNNSKGIELKQVVDAMSRGAKRRLGVVEGLPRQA
jgi:hypothetical protein